MAIENYTENDEISVEQIQKVQSYYAAWLFLTISAIETTKNGSEAYLRYLVNGNEEKDASDIVINDDDEFGIFEPID